MGIFHGHAIVSVPFVNASNVMLSGGCGLTAVGRVINQISCLSPILAPKKSLGTRIPNQPSNHVDPLSQIANGATGEPM